MLHFEACQSSKCEFSVDRIGQSEESSIILSPLTPTIPEGWIQRKCFQDRIFKASPQE